MYIGIDLGGTNVRIAGSKNLEQVEFAKVERFELSKKFDEDFEKIVSMIKKVSDGEVEAIGIGLPGTLKCGILISGGNAVEWVRKPFIRNLAKEFNCPVFADNDAVVASLGEALHGAGQHKNFLYLTWGTGIGGSNVKNENGKVSSQKIPWRIYLKEADGRCGGGGIFRKFSKKASDLDEVEWEEVMGDMELYLEDISNKFKEKKMILGGGITAKQKNRLESVIRNLKLKDIQLETSDLGDDVGLYGAMTFINIKKKQS